MPTQGKEMLCAGHNLSWAEAETNRKERRSPDTKCQLIEMSSFQLCVWEKGETLTFAERLQTFAIRAFFLPKWLKLFNLGRIDTEQQQQQHCVSE